MMSTMRALMLGPSEKRVVAIECFGFLTDFDGSRVDSRVSLDTTVSRH